MSGESSELVSLIKPEIIEEATLSSCVLPQKSSERYIIEYNGFMDWKSSSNKDSFSENVLLEYFNSLSGKFKSSTLWNKYSMLKATLSIKHNVNIDSYPKLRALLKRIAQNYVAIKAKTFTPAQIKKFIEEAPDYEHLATKVALIMGITGGCKRTELYNLKVENIQDLKKLLLVTIPQLKNNTRQFVIKNTYYDICQKYIKLRPSGYSGPAFFISYQKGRCTFQRIGINKFSAMGKSIADFLKLPNAKLYSGHSFRRSSASILVDYGADISDINDIRDITSIKREGSCESNTEAEDYESITEKMETASANSNSIENSLQFDDENGENSNDSFEEKPNMYDSNDSYEEKPNMYDLDSSSDNDNTQTFFNINPTENNTFTKNIDAKNTNMIPTLKFINCSGNITLNFYS